MDVTINCICPGKPHQTDTVTLRTPLDFDTAFTIRNEVNVLRATEKASTARIMTLLAELYLTRCIESWTVETESGAPADLSEESIRSTLMKHLTQAMVVSDAADTLYSDDLLPLLLGASSSSQPSPTASSTSRTNGSTPRRPKRSKPSSITTIPTVDTATTSTSLDGDSRSSLSSA